MERVDPQRVENSLQPAATMRPLTEALGCTDMALNYYELGPGDSFAFAYHAHEVQEEVFYVLSGTATFETEEGPVEVGPDQAVRFGPGEFQRGWNEGEERVRALAMGAPLEYGDQPKLRDCPDCGERTENDLREAEDEEDAVVAVCQVCGSETGRWYEGEMEGRVP